MSDDSPDLYRFYIFEQGHIVRAEIFECVYAEFEAKCQALLAMNRHADKVEIWLGPKIGRAHV